MNAKTKMTFIIIKLWPAAATTYNDRMGKYKYKRGILQNYIILPL
jgi:hypothetical protein